MATKLNDSLVLLALLLYSFGISLLMSQNSDHENLTRAAHAVRAASSELKGSVSKHVMPETIAFTAVHTLHEAAKGLAGKSHCDFLTVRQEQLIFSYACNYEKTTNGKRKHEMGVEEDVEKMLQPLSNKVDIEQSAKAKEVAVRLLRDLKGTNHERLVQSVVIAHQKLRVNDANPRVIIAARMASGVPIPVGKLKGALGDCWADGALTIDNSSELVSSFELPVSEQGKIAEQLGHRSLRLVTALPVSSVHATPPNGHVG
jgi:hypothetical protein